MPIENINRGTAANNGTGTTAREGADIINANFAYLDGRIDAVSNEVKNGTKVISGGYVWSSGLTFLAQDLVYAFNGVPKYIPDGDIKTSPTADATHPRVDRILGDENGNTIVWDGVPSTPAVAKAFDPTLYILLSEYTVPAGATVPDGVSQQVVFADNTGTPTEADVTESTSGARVSIGTEIATLAPLLDADEITFALNAAVLFSNLQAIRFDIAATENWGNDYITCKFYNGTDYQGSVLIYKKFVDITTTDVQTVTIFFNEFNMWTGYTQFDKIVLSARVFGASNLSFTFDNFKLLFDEGAVDVSNYITEAPKDGTTYGRKDGVWFAIPGGGGSSPNTTKGDLFTHNGTQDEKLGVGKDGEVLTADSKEPTGLKWSSPLKQSETYFINEKTMPFSSSSSIITNDAIYYGS